MFENVIFFIDKFIFKRAHVVSSVLYILFLCCNVMKVNDELKSKNDEIEQKENEHKNQLEELNNKLSTVNKKLTFLFNFF